MREITVFATEGIFTLGISDIGSLVVVGRKEGKKKQLSGVLAADRFEIIV